MEPGYAVTVAGSSQTMRLGDRVRAPGRGGTEEVQATVVGFFDSPKPSRFGEGAWEGFVWVRYDDGHVTPWPASRVQPMAD
jgi:hypothetical protein